MTTPLSFKSIGLELKTTPFINKQQHLYTQTD